MTYNGWHNWDTWNCNLWLANDYNYYLSIEAKAEELRQNHQEGDNLVSPEIIPLLAEFIRDFVICAKVVGDGFDINNVQFEDIAEGWLS